LTGTCYCKEGMWWK